MSQMKFILMAGLVILTLTLPAHAGAFRLKTVCDLDNAVAAGHYDWVHQAFRSGKVPKTACKEGGNVVLRFHTYALKSGQFIGTDQVLKDMREVDCRPATWPELLALGAAKPEIQRYDIVVALGSLVPLMGGAMGAPSLNGDRDERSLTLFDSANGWVADDYGFPYVFAAVCGGGSGK